LEAQLGHETSLAAGARIKAFLEKRDAGALLTTDQLLNAVFLAGAGLDQTMDGLAEAIEAVMRPLTR
jgi:hypothetical protein